MKNEFHQPDASRMRKILDRHRDDPVGAILRLAWLQGLSREEIATLRWMHIDFQSAMIFLEDRSIPLDEETLRCLKSRALRYERRSEYVVISDKFKEKLPPESISRLARQALDQGGEGTVRLKDLRRDFFLRQLAEHDWHYAIRVCGFSVSTFHACFSDAPQRKKTPLQEEREVDEFKLWQVLQRENSSAVGLALWMSWQMGVQAKDLAAATWDQADLSAGRLCLAGESIPMTNAVRRLLEKERQSRRPGEDPHILLSPKSRSPLDVPRLSKMAQTALIRGGLEGVTLRDVRAAGEWRNQEKLLLEHARTRGGVTRGEAMALLGLSDTAAYLRLRRLAERKELERVGRRYYLPGTVVPEERQWDAICEYLRENGFAYCQDIAGRLHVGRRKAAGILKRLVESGRLTQFEKRYYLAREDGQRQLQ